VLLKGDLGEDVYVDAGASTTPRSDSVTRTDAQPCCFGDRAVEPGRRQLSRQPLADASALLARDAAPAGQVESLSTLRRLVTALTHGRMPAHSASRSDSCSSLRVSDMDQRGRRGVDCALAG